MLGLTPAEPVVLWIEGQQDKGREVSPKDPGGLGVYVQQRVSVSCSSLMSEMGHMVSTSCYYEMSSEVHASLTLVLSTV